MTDNRKLICFAGVRCNRLLRFAGHRLGIAGRVDAGSKISRRASKFGAPRTSSVARDSSSERGFRSAILGLVGILEGSLLYIRGWQIWMRVFRIGGRSLDRGAGGANSLLNFLFSCCQRIVRNVQRALLYFRVDYAVQRFDRIGYFLLVSGISQFVDFNS